MTFCPLPKWGGKLGAEWTDECSVCSLTILVPHATSTGVSLFKKTLSWDQWILWARHACLCLVYRVNSAWGSCLSHWSCKWTYFKVKTPLLGHSTCSLKKKQAYDPSENVTLALTNAKIFPLSHDLLAKPINKSFSELEAYQWHWFAAPWVNYKQTHCIIFHHVFKWKHCKIYESYLESQV